MKSTQQGGSLAIAALTLVVLVSCSSSDSGTPASTTGGSAALQGPQVLVNNTGDKTLTSILMKGDSGNAVVGTIDAAKFGNVALGDMQFSEGEWLFVNLGSGNAVAFVDPLTGAFPVHEANLMTGTRPVHIYRDPNDGEVIWSMNDGDNAGGTSTPGDDLVNCAAHGGGSVTVIHNSHLGPGANVPRILGTTCVLADGHKVTAFSSGAGIPRRAFVSSEVGGEIAVIDNDETSANYRKMIARIDLCKSAKEPAPCNDESATPLTTAFTPNTSAPHGIRWSQLTKKMYSIQEGYDEIAEIDPTTLAITNTFALTGTPYTAYGISPDGRFLLLRGDTTPPSGTKLGVLDLGQTPPVRTDFTIAALDGTAPGSFKFSPDGKRFYILAGNTATATKKDRLFAFDSSTLTATPPALMLLQEIVLVAGGAHSMDVLAQGAPGAGAAQYVVVSNSTANSVSIINAADNTIKQNVPVGPVPGALMIYYPGAAAANNQATSSLVSGGGTVTSSPLPERLDDYGMRQ